MALYLFSWRKECERCNDVLMFCIWFQQIRKATLFRPEDPNKLLQVLPPVWQHHEVARIKGFRSPSPGSQVAPSVPIRESSDDIYNTNYYFRNPRNLKTGVCIAHCQFAVEKKMILMIVAGFIFFVQDTTFLDTGKKTYLIGEDKPNLPTAYKRKINLLPYDPSGLRTTKTTTWDAVNQVLEKRVVVNHLPNPIWAKEADAIDAAREKKGLPPAVGKPYKFAYASKNYNQVRW